MVLLNLYQQMVHIHSLYLLMVASYGGGGVMVRRSGALVLKRYKYTSVLLVVLDLVLHEVHLVILDQLVLVELQRLMVQVVEMVQVFVMLHQ